MCMVSRHNLEALWRVWIAAPGAGPASGGDNDQATGCISPDQPAILAVALNRPLLKRAQGLFGQVDLGLRLGLGGAGKNQREDNSKKTDHP